MAETQDNLMKNILQRLEKICDEVTRAQGYNEDVEKLKMLVELTREQVHNEDFDSTAG